MIAPQAPALIGEALVAGYDGRTVLHEVSLTLYPGELIGLIGPNGAGKSTLLKALSNVLSPRSGDVRLFGTPIAQCRASERARKLAYVPQSEPALFDFTVRQVVQMGRHAYVRRFASDTDEDYHMVAKALGMLDLAHLADRPVTMLSGGEHRRVLIARAIAQAAPIWLLDEPTAHLDLAHQSEVIRIIAERCASERTAAIAALHDLNLAADHCSRLVLVAHGRVLADGPPEMVLTEEILRDAYGSEIVVARNPVSLRPLVVPAIGGKSPSKAGGSWVHVIGGGGSASGVLAALKRAGYNVSAGVLNRLDSDEEAASMLDIPCAREAPFSPISDIAWDQARGMVERADAVVVASLPIGHGNLRNLELADLAVRKGLPVIVVSDRLPAERDFTEGRGARALTELEQRASVVLPDWGTVESTLRRLISGEQPCVGPSG